MFFPPSESNSQDGATLVHPPSASAQLQSTPVEKSMTPALSSASNPTAEDALREPPVAASDSKEGRLEHPVFPWQRKKRERATTVLMEDHKAAIATEHQMHQPRVELEARPVESEPPSQPMDIPSSSHGLTGQSIQIPPSLTSWEREREDAREEVKSLQQRVKELESELERESTQKKELQVIIWQCTALPFSVAQYCTTHYTMSYVHARVLLKP